MTHPTAEPASKKVRPTLVPVLLAGGNGSRLWPLSRKDYPKQYLKLRGRNSLLQDALQRTAKLPDVSNPVIIGSHKHRFLLAEQLRELDIHASVILEPEGRDTAPAVAVAAEFVTRTYGPNAMLLICPADQVISDETAFLQATQHAVAGAQRGQIVTFGITPTRAETGFGYLQAGASINGIDGYKVQRFVEKPDTENAEKFVADSNYFWNGGMFLFRAEVIRKAFTRHEPAMLEAAEQALGLAEKDDDCLHLNADKFSLCRAESIDYALMEKLDNLLLVPLDAGWDDVGSFRYMDNDPPSDEHDNRIVGDVMLDNAHNNLVISSKRLVAVGGVDNLIVVETEDAVMVINRDHSQKVKAFYQQLCDEKRCEADHRARVHRPWGTYETVAEGPRFQSKRIMVKPGCQLSLQMHHHRAEHWVVVRGTALVTRGEEEFLLSENESTYIPLGTKHRLKNPGHVPLELIEVQSGSYLGEDDIVRFDDAYGRADAPQDEPLQGQKLDLLQRRVA